MAVFASLDCTLSPISSFYSLVHLIFSFNCIVIHLLSPQNLLILNRLLGLIDFLLVVILFFQSLLLFPLKLNYALGINLWLSKSRFRGESPPLCFSDLVPEEAGGATGLAAAATTYATAATASKGRLAVSLIELITLCALCFCVK